MRIDADKCGGCEKCIPLCVGSAIALVGDTCVVDDDLCVECLACSRSGICPENAFEETSLEWPRILRHTFSSVHAIRTGAKIIHGRGTAEMKTNDVTDRYRFGEVGFTVDVGRPGVCATFADVEKISMAAAAKGVEFISKNPTTELMTDTVSGTFRDDVKGERILSCILEFKTREENCLAVIEALKRVANDVNTVFSVGCISRCNPNGMAPVQAILDKAGIFYRPNGKTNIGLGWIRRPGIGR